MLALNAGSSSLKCAVFTLDAEPTQVWSRAISRSETTPATVVEQVFAAIDGDLDHCALAGIVHRVVHGGERFDRAQRVTMETIAGLRELLPLAPNHLPDEIALIDACSRARPGTPQVVCFDTAFHRDLPAISRTLAVPHLAGLRRYGFHGLSFAFLLSELGKIDGNEALGRVVLAHLGSGASLAAVVGGRCVDTSMGLTPSGGVVMSSRSGDLDPGVVTYLARQHGWSIDQIDHALTTESGLVAISGGTADMQALLAHEASDPRARLAVDIFCYQVRKWIGAFAAALGGLDTLVFAGGIGEHAPLVRARICQDLGFLGVRLDGAQNARNASIISTSAAGARVRVIPTNEALMMAREAYQVLRNGGST